MTLTRITAPAVEFISLDEAKDHLRIDADDEDALVARYISTVNAVLDGNDGQLGRALTTQTWRLDLRFFPFEIPLPLPPLISVGSVKYYNSADALTTVATTVYEVDAGGTSGGCVRLLGNQVWPTDISTARGKPVQITFNAGYGPSWNDVPKPLVGAAMFLLGHFYENREAVSVGSDIAVKVPLTFDDLIGPYRVIGFG